MHRHDTAIHDGMHSFASDCPNLMVQSIYIMEIGIVFVLQKS